MQSYIAFYDAKLRVIYSDLVYDNAIIAGFFKLKLLNLPLSKKINCHIDLLLQ